MASQPQGIDVSSRQSGIDWQKAATQIDFAFIKRSEGTGYLNPLFTSQWAGAKAAGLLRSAYHFFRWDVDAAQQAAFFVHNLGTDLGELPCVVDIENEGDGAGPHNYSVAEMVARVRTFIDIVKVQTARDVIVYTYSSMWRDTLGNPTNFTDCPLWLASYRPTMPAPVGGWSTVTFWQFTDRGVVAGVPGTVDCNYFNGTLDQLRQLAGITAPTPDTYTDPATGKSISHGFLAYWMDHPYLGHPLTNEFQFTLEDGNQYVVQCFERGLLHWRMGDSVQEARIGAMWMAAANIAA